MGGSTRGYEEPTAPKFGAANEAVPVHVALKVELNSVGLTEFSRGVSCSDIKISL